MLGTFFLGNGCRGARQVCDRLGAVLSVALALGCSSLANVKTAYQATAQADASARVSDGHSPAVASSRATTPPSSDPSESEAAPVAPTTNCPITLQLVNRDASESDDESDAAGVRLAGAGKVRMVSEKVCLALNGEIALPTDFRLWVNDAGWNGYRVCRESTVQKTDVPNVVTCQWNGTFRHSYPWTIKLRSSDKAPLARRVQSVRIFRNGELAFAWVPNAESGLDELVIDGEELKGRLLPENAPMDLRIIPKGIKVDPVLLAEKVQTRPRQWEVQLELASKALLTSPQLANGALQQRADCIIYRSKMLAHRAAQLVGAKRDEPKPPPGSESVDACRVAAAPDPPTSLRQRYEKLENGKGQSSLEQVDREFGEAVEQYRERLSGPERAVFAEFERDARLFWEGRGPLWSAQRGQHTDAERQAFLALLIAPATRRVIMDDPAALWKRKAPEVASLAGPPTEAEAVWLQTRGTRAELEFLLAQADAMISEGLQAVDDTLALQADLRKDAVRIASSPDEQARLFLRLADSLQGSSPLLAIADNPELLPGERGLRMRYSDRWQFFFLAPWTGFPVGLDGEPDFTAANLIPIIDVLGWRYQFTGSRFADVRLGLGLTALSFTFERARRDPVSGDETVDEEKLLRLAPEANLGLANLKVGMSFIIKDDMPTQQRWRVIVGADLYKLISGRNVEVATQ